MVGIIGVYCRAWMRWWDRVWWRWWLHSVFYVLRTGSAEVVFIVKRTDFVGSILVDSFCFD